MRHPVWLHSKYMTDLHMPKLWYIARIKWINDSLSQLPVVKFGVHRDIPIIRLYDGDKQREYRKTSKHYSEYYGIAVNREILLSEKDRLLQDWKRLFNEPYESLASQYKLNPNNMACKISLSESLQANSNSYKNDNEYFLDTDNYRSRIELRVAEALEEFGINFKYEAKISLGTNTRCPDFTLLFPEFGCCVFLEVLGKMNENSYAFSRGTLIAEYSTSNLLLGRDVYLICGTNNYIPNINLIKMDIINIVNRLCEMRLVKNT